MRRFEITLLILILASSFAGACAVNAQVSFHGLGDLPGGYTGSYPSWVSNQGVVVGNSYGDEGTEAFIYRSNEGMQGLGLLQPTPSIPPTRQGSVMEAGSNDATRFVGYSFINSDWDAVSYTSNGSSDVLSRLDPSAADNYAHGISADGRVIVGTSNSQAVIWDEAGAVHRLGSLEGAPSPYGTYGYAISADGTRVVGRARGKDGFESFIWSKDVGMQSLGSLAGGPYGGPYGSRSYSEAGDISADGMTVVGFARESYRMVPYRWTQSEGMKSLGNFEDDFIDGNLTDLWREIAVSSDGEVIVGFNGTHADDGAFIYTDEIGMQRLSVFLATLGLNLDGWSLFAASAISSDGKTIVGTGRNSQGEVEGWIAVIPEPSTALMILLGLAGLSFRGRRAV